MRGFIIIEGSQESGVGEEIIQRKGLEAEEGKGIGWEEVGKGGACTARDRHAGGHVALGLT